MPTPFGNTPRDVSEICTLAAAPYADCAACPGPVREAVQEQHAFPVLGSRKAAVEGQTVRMHLPSKGSTGRVSDCRRGGTYEYTANYLKQLYHELPKTFLRAYTMYYQKHLEFRLCCASIEKTNHS